MELKKFELQNGDVLLLPLENVFQYLGVTDDKEEFDDQIMFLIKYQVFPLLKKYVPDFQTKYKTFEPFLTWQLQQSNGEVMEYFNSIKGKFKYNYIHQELYIDGGWTFVGQMSGTEFRKINSKYISLFHVYRHRFQKPEKFKDVYLQFWNKKYDYLSLFMDSGIEIQTQIFKLNEKMLEDIIGKFYNTESELKCSELVQRVYDKQGYKDMWNKLEFVTPQDIQESDYFHRIQ